MSWFVVFAVASCCGYAVGASWQRLAKLRRLGEFEPRGVLAELRRVGPDALAGSDIPSEFHEELMYAFHSTPRRAAAAYSGILLQVQAVLDDGRLLEVGAWRICVAAAASGLLLVVWSSRWAAVVVVAIGLSSTVVSLWVGRSAELRRRRSRAAWNALIRGCPESFTPKTVEG